MRCEIDTSYPWLVIRKIRPVYNWERKLKWSAPLTGDEICMMVWQQQTIGM